MTDTTASTPTTKGRSPGYPWLTLERAIDRLRELNDAEGRNAVPLMAAFRAWKYEGKSGDGNLVASALRKYGLLAYEGVGAGRRVRITPLGFEVLEHPDPAVRQAAIREAALHPAIHQQLWAKHKGSDRLPSDDSLRWELKHERGFTPTGADEFIPVYKATLEFAGLTPGGRSEPQGGATGADEGAGDDDDSEFDQAQERQSLNRDRKPRRARNGGTAVVEIAVPIPGFAADQRAILELPGKLTEAQWSYMVNIINAMKDGVLRTDDDLDG